MRILHLCDRLSCRGGADWHLLGVLESLKAKHEVHIAVGHDDGTAVAPCSMTVVPGLDARVRQPIVLDALLDATTPDVIHLHNIVNPHVLAWAGAHRALMTVQDHRAFCPGRGKWTAQGQVCRSPMSTKACVGCFDDPAYFRRIFDVTRERLESMGGLHLTVLSHYMKEELCAVGCDPNGITVIPPFVHGIDANAPADGPACALFVGRLASTKGVYEALDAWRQAQVDVPLVFAGTGPQRGKLEALGCRVLGWQSHAELSHWYRRALVLLMPSRWQEPFGIVGLEALAAGTNVAAWQSGGVAQWHPGPDLGLVPWGDVRGLADAARALCGTRATAPSGFAREPLMQRLMDLYGAIAASDAAPCKPRTQEP